MRYILLILLNLPIILLAVMNILTQYKLGAISARRFRGQLAFWLLLLTVLIVSFPVYNHVSHNPALDANSLSLFDIAQTTAVIYLIYIVNNQRRKIERNEKNIRRLHQEISIKLSVKNGKN